MIRPTFAEDEIRGGYRVLGESGKARQGHVLWFATCIHCGRMALLTTRDIRGNTHGCPRCATKTRERREGKFAAKESDHAKRPRALYRGP